MPSRYYVLIQPQTSAEKCRYRRAHQKQASNMSVCSKPTCFFGTFPDSQSELFLTLMDACLPICLFVSKRPKLTLRTLLKCVNACLAMYIRKLYTCVVSSGTPTPSPRRHRERLLSQRKRQRFSQSASKRAAVAGTRRFSGLARG